MTGERCWQRLGSEQVEKSISGAAGWRSTGLDVCACVWLCGLAVWQTCMPPRSVWGCVRDMVSHPDRVRNVPDWDTAVGHDDGMATDGCEHPGMQDAPSTAFLKNCLGLCHPLSTTLLSAGWDLLGACCRVVVGSTLGYAIKTPCSCCIVRLFSVASAWLVPCSLLSCWLVALPHRPGACRGRGGRWGN